MCVFDRTVPPFTQPIPIIPNTTQAQIQEWADPPAINPALTLPGANDFVPTDFALRADAPQYLVSLDVGCEDN